MLQHHSVFSCADPFQWENPRVTGISYAATVLTIFAIRYLPALRWSLKILYVILGLTALVEVSGKVLLRQSLASTIRPRKYYTIPRETLEASLEDAEQLINFFVIEFQRILFAENEVVTAAVCIVHYQEIVFTDWFLRLLLPPSYRTG